MIELIGISINCHVLISVINNDIHKTSVFLRNAFRVIVKIHCTRLRVFFTSKNMNSDGSRLFYKMPWHSIRFLYVPGLYQPNNQTGIPQLFHLYLLYDNSSSWIYTCGFSCVFGVIVRGLRACRCTCWYLPVTFIA